MRLYYDGVEVGILPIGRYGWLRQRSLAQLARLRSHERNP